jgi:hypothetical protein
LLNRLEASRRELDGADRSGRLAAWDAARHQAVRLLSAARPGKHNPFDLSQEPARVRDRYGREEWDQGFLVARRLVEAGVRMVQVNLRWWFSHHLSTLRKPLERFKLKRLKLCSRKNFWRFSTGFTAILLQSNMRAPGFFRILRTWVCGFAFTSEGKDMLVSWGVA